MKIEYWDINPQLKKEAEEDYRNNLAISIQDKTGLEILRRLTFDGVLANMTVVLIENLLNYLENNFLERGFYGVGLEVGSGPGTFSSAIAKKSSVSKMYAVEICQPIVELLMPKVSEYILGRNSDKVVGAVGEFNRINLPNNYLDFIFDFFSFHHSTDISITFKECFRVLKPGGFVLCLDKARPNYFKQEDLDFLLDSDVNKKRLELSGDEKVTRGMVGEREYRLKDWKLAFNNAGFTEIHYFYLDNTKGANFISTSVKNFISLLPIKLQLILGKYLPKPRINHKFRLELKNRVYSRFINPFRKEMSLIIAYK